MRLLLLSIWVLFSTNLSAQIIIHSHNDYEQKQPFFAAYNLGFDSIEADLYLKDGELYVAHDWKNVTPERTLKSLYIEPLLAKIKENNGFPYPNKKPLQLLLDLKKDGKEILKVLYAQLKPHAKELRHVRIAISGDMPAPDEFQNFDKMFFFDGRKNLIYSKDAYKRVALVSASFLDFGKYWAGKEPMPEETFQKISTFVEETHAKGKKVRIWGTPNTTLGFETLQKLKIDIIGTDDLELLAKFKQ
ncbi:phosphatidylinositol-specific phospholipase C/glycerophosphodiester phosphodiesterase family protein [Emticicia sp. SJ17W-69]|uniref:phosphatidylinositol-specific phospholipase C/glycerophosphodiester phosphodiesterase family protein n=1 Tax=Emticicia sp. SJ17W-69 TaxID=3421657 RepID=UPI003EB91641